MERMDGIVVLDKPAGISSFKAVQSVRQICRARKSVHTGTLDPMATGILVVCLGRATKLAQFMMHGRKIYTGEMQLGISTDTYDAQGKTVAQSSVPETIDLDVIRNAASHFTGRIRQIPPPFSAIKHKGIPLYKLAREGKSVTKEAREVEIYSFVIIEYNPPYVKFEVECSPGTYIRSLVHDLGKRLGCGACMTSLRRTANGSVDIDIAVTLDELSQAAKRGRLHEVILDVETALEHIMPVTVSRAEAEHIRHGRPVVSASIWEHIRQKGLVQHDSSAQYIRIKTEDGPVSNLIAIARIPSSGSERIRTLKVWNTNIKKQKKGNMQISISRGKEEKRGFNA
jgi:tRNA pseudouridine55 synthase